MPITATNGVVPVTPIVGPFVSADTETTNPRLEVPLGPSTAASIVNSGSVVETVFDPADLPEAPTGHAWVATGRVFESYPPQYEYQSYPKMIALREGDGIPGVPGGYKYIATGRVFESLPPAYEYALKTPEEVAALSTANGVDPSTIAKIEDVRFSEIPYAAVQSRVRRALKADPAITAKLTNEQIAQLADDILNYENNDKAVADLIAAALDPQPAPAGVDPGTVAAIEDVRFSEIPYGAVLARVQEALEADPAVSAAMTGEQIAQLASSILSYENNDEAVADLIAAALAPAPEPEPEPEPAAPSFLTSGKTFITNSQPLPSAEFDLQSARLEGDELVIDVSFGGGFKEHAVGVQWDGMFLESYPVQVNLRVVHEIEGGFDPAEALLHRTVRVDLSALKHAYQSAYRTDHGTIMFGLGDQRFSYEF